MTDNDLANNKSERASAEYTLEEKESDKESKGEDRDKDPKDYYENYYNNDHIMPPKKETKPPAKKRSPKPVKSKTSTDDTGASSPINNLTLNRPPYQSIGTSRTSMCFLS